MIHRGRLVELAETAELFESPVHPYTQALVKAASFEELPGEMDVDLAGPVSKSSLTEITPGHWAAL